MQNTVLFNNGLTENLPFYESFEIHSKLEHRYYSFRNLSEPMMLEARS